MTVLSTEVYVVGSDGSRLDRLTHENAFLGSPSWAADGRSLVAFSATIDAVRVVTGPQRARGTSEIVTIDAISGAVQAVTADFGEKWSPQQVAADRIGYVSGGPAGGVEFTSGTAGIRGQFRDPNRSSDGKALEFDCRRTLFHDDERSALGPLGRIETIASPSLSAERFR